MSGSSWELIAEIYTGNKANWKKLSEENSGNLKAGLSIYIPWNLLTKEIDNVLSKNKFIHVRIKSGDTLLSIVEELCSTTSDKIVKTIAAINNLNDGKYLLYSEETLWIPQGYVKNNVQNIEVSPGNQNLFQLPALKKVIL